MGVRTRVEAFDRDAFLTLGADMTPTSQSKALAQFSREQLALADAQNAQALGAPAPHDTFVDGAASEDLDRVRPNGTILFEFQLFDDVLLFIAELLAKNSPVRSGRYTASHVLYADGQEVDIHDVPPAAETYTFTNVQPYARKIERGESKQAPDGVFEAVAALASARYGNLARIRFAYVSPTGGNSPIEQYANAKMGGDTNRRAQKQRDRDTRQPAIVVTFR